MALAVPFASFTTHRRRASFQQSIKRHPKGNKLVLELFVFQHVGRGHCSILVLFQPFPHLALAACAVRAVFAPALFAAFCNVAEVAIESKPTVRKFCFI